MLPGDIPGRGVPGRGACGRGIGRSTGCAEENGLLPTRGVRAAGLGALGVGPGLGPGVGAGRAGGAAGAAGSAAVAAAAGGGAGAAGSAGGGAGLGAGAFSGAAGLAAATLAGEPLPSALTFAAADFAPPNDSRRRRATGASTVDDADLTNSPCSLSRARTSLLVTPSSLANSCTRALPATTSPSLEATAVVGAAPRVSYDAWSSGLHGVLMFFATCSLAGQILHLSCAQVLDHRGNIR